MAFIPLDSIFQRASRRCPGEPLADMTTARAVLESLGVVDDQYAIGRTKVFLKQGVLSELNRLRLEHISDFATMVQASIRRLLALRKLRKLRDAAARKEEVLEN